MQVSELEEEPVWPVLPSKKRSTHAEPSQCGARHITHTQCGARRIAPTPRVALRGSARKPCVGTIQPAKRDRSPQRRDAGQVKSGPLGRHYACHLIGASMTLFRPRATRCHGA